MSLPDRITLDGNGLRLREWADADLPAMVELFDEPEVARWTPWPAPFDLAAARRHLDQARTRRVEGRSIQLAVTTDGRTPLGEVLLFPTGPDGRDPAGPDAELGYAIGLAHRGQGLATCAVEVMTGYAIRELAVRHVILHIDAGNAASARVARSAGFRLVGEAANAGTRRTWRR